MSVELQRTLGAWELICLGVGAIVGAGIFVVTGMVAALHAGPAVVLSFVLAALACLCAALCYAEFATMMPVAGSAYSYTYAAFGRIPAWLVGWCLVLEYLMAASSVAVGWGGYLMGALREINLALPEAMTSGPLAGGIINLPPFLLILALTALLLQGVRVSARMTVILVVVKLTTLALFIGIGLFFVRPSLWHPFLPPNTGAFGSFGWSGVLRGAALVFYAFLGFDTVSTAARETRNPQRNMPIGIVGSLAICTGVFVAFCAVLTGLAPYVTLNVPNPASFALAHADARLLPLQWIVEIGVVVGLVAVVLVLLYGQSRILFALAQDGLVPAGFGRVSRQSHGPRAAVLGSGAGAALLAAALPLEVLGELVSIGTLCAFSVVCVATLYLRVRRPEIVRPFRVRAAPLVCIGGVLACVYLMAGLPGRTWLNFLGWLAVGSGIYLAFGRASDHKHRAMHAGEPNIEH